MAKFKKDIVEAIEEQRKMKVAGERVIKKASEKIKESLPDKEVRESLVKYAEEKGLALTPGDFEKAAKEFANLKEHLEEYIHSGDKDTLLEAVRLIKSHALLNTYKAMIFATPKEMPYVVSKLLDVINKLEIRTKEVEIKERWITLKEEEARAKDRDKALSLKDIEEKMAEIDRRLKGK